MSHPSKTTPGHPVSVASHLSFEGEETDDLKSFFKAGFGRKMFSPPKKREDNVQDLANFSQKKHGATLLSPHQPWHQPSFPRVWIPRNSPQERYSPGSEPSFARFATKSDTWYQISTMRLCSLGLKQSKGQEKKGQ